MSAIPDDEIQRLQGQVAENPSDLGLRFELGAALWKRREDIAAMTELQKAMARASLRRNAGELLAEIFDARGMTQTADRMRRMISDDPPDDSGSAPIPVRTDPRPPRRPDGSAEEKLPRNEHNA